MTTSLLTKSEREEPPCAKPQGCQHYKRNVKLVAPCCNKVYTCRFYHDDEESHPMKRKEVIEVVCAACDLRQYLQKECKSCDVLFGKYSCLACRLFDDEFRGQFHCAKCAICRVGGRSNYYHCKKCDICISPINRRQEFKHVCVENGSHSDCPFCSEDLHSSTKNVHLAGCGHYLHGKCVEEAGKQACPVCLKNFE